MGETYSDNADIVFDNGKPVDSLLERNITADQRRDILTKARERSYNLINSRLQGKTAIPAVHIPVLKQVEVDFVLGEFIAAAFTSESANLSEWGTNYEQRANTTLDNLYFAASATEPEPGIQNTGDGYVKILSVNEHFAVTEIWTLRANNSSDFSVIGSVHGVFPNLTVGVAYPEKDWSGYSSDYGMRYSDCPPFDQFPFYCKVIDGSTAFEEGDLFTFEVFASSHSKNKIATGRLVRA